MRPAPDHEREQDAHSQEQLKERPERASDRGLGDLADVHGGCYADATWKRSVKG